MHARSATLRVWMTGNAANAYSMGPKPLKVKLDPLASSYSYPLGSLLRLVLERVATLGILSRPLFRPVFAILAEIVIIVFQLVT
jgi:hypothetical protein